MEMTISQFLVWLTAGGAAVAVSWIAEKIPAFQSLSSAWKQIVMFIFSSVLGIGALYITNNVPPEVLAQYDGYFAVLVSTFGVYFLNQLAHTLDPKRN